ncbi:MAG: PAS domain-containing protein [Synergistaceae bacterium]|jgi:PAS domain-containing protein|nr:PAS domain-containing protein [Synergistaceae bacterium]
MDAVRDLSLIINAFNALPDGVLIISPTRGKIVGANSVFFERSGLSEIDLVDVQLIDVPLFKKRIKQGLLRLFVKAVHGRGHGMSFSFPYVNPERMVKNISASAECFTLAEQEYVIFTFKELPPQEILIPGEESASWKAYLSLAYEPYMEFRPVAPIEPLREQDERMSYLKFAEDALKVKFANDAAGAFYRGGGGSLIGATFGSFFNKEDDALRFLDMLAAVGEMKAETVVNTYNRVAQVEMHCGVKFDDEGAIAAVYCAQRDLTGHQRYEAIIGGSRLEMDFAFNQPFTGFAFLAPQHPIERPEADNVDAKLDDILDQILIMRANQAMVDIYNTDKARFLMKPMRGLFADMNTARQVMKELFVMRTTSVERYASSEEKVEGVLERVSIFRSVFDTADCLSGVYVATSKDDRNYKARHSNKNKIAQEKEQEQEQEQEQEETQTPETQLPETAETQMSETPETQTLET